MSAEIHDKISSIVGKAANDAVKQILLGLYDAAVTRNDASEVGRLVAGSNLDDVKVWFANLGGMSVELTMPYALAAKGDRCIMDVEKMAFRDSNNREVSLSIGLSIKC